MNEMIDLNSLTQASLQDLDLFSVLISFFACTVMSFIVRAFYVKRSFSLTGKSHIGSILPILSCTVFLVILVVKSSLALSLGLVGALSIVRFRTPIKEPEELVYLFLAIALGLGYGAGHVFLTTILTVFILLIIYFWLSNLSNTNVGEYNLVLNWNNVDVSFEQLSKIVADFSQSVKLIRLDRGANGNTAILMIAPNDKVNFDSVMNALRDYDSTINMTFYESKTNW